MQTKAVDTTVNNEYGFNQWEHLQDQFEDDDSYTNVVKIGKRKSFDESKKRDKERREQRQHKRQDWS